MGIWNYFAPDIQEPTETSFSYIKFTVIAGSISLVLFGTGYVMSSLAKVTTSLKSKDINVPDLNKSSDIM